VPTAAPTQLNESATSAPSSSSETVAKADENASVSTDPPKADAAKDDAKNASSSRKVKKKHHFHIPIPL